MAPELELRFDARRWTRGLSRLERREAPFALALGLTRTAQDIRGNTVRRMGRVLDRPTRFTLNAFKVVPARKTRPVAIVGFRTFSATSVGNRSYLEPLEFGGPRPPKRFEKRLRRVGVMREDEFAVPARGFRLNRFGNIPASRIVQILSQLQAAGGSGFDANETDKSRKRAGKSRTRYFAVGGRSNRRQGLPRGIYQRTGRKQRKVKGVMMFVRRPTYRAILGFNDGARKTSQARLRVNINRAMEQAVRSSRLRGR